MPDQNLDEATLPSGLQKHEQPSFVNGFVDSEGLAFEHLSRQAFSGSSILCRVYYSSLILRVLASALLLSPSGQRLQELSEERAGSTTWSLRTWAAVRNADSEEE